MSLSDQELLDAQRDSILMRLYARVKELETELEGDGSHDPNPLKALGLRHCFELRGEHIALAEAAEKKALVRAEKAEARVRELENELARRMD